MNDKIIFGVLGFFAGAIVGGLTVGNLCRKRHKDVVEEIKNRHKQSLERLRDSLAEYENDETEENGDEDDDLDFDDPFSDCEDEGETYATLSRMYKSDTFDEEFSTRAHPDERDEDPDDIRIISKNIYDEDLEVRDAETLYYYQEDGILLDGAHNPITDQMRVIGFDAMEELETTKADIIYVSNDIEDKMYEIVVVRCGTEVE